MYIKSIFYDVTFCNKRCLLSLCLLFVCYIKCIASLYFSCNKGVCPPCICLLYKTYVKSVLWYDILPYKRVCSPFVPYIKCTASPCFIIWHLVMIWCACGETSSSCRQSSDHMPAEALCLYKCKLLLFQLSVEYHLHLVSVLLDLFNWLLLCYRVWTKRYNQKNLTLQHWLCF